VTAYQRFYRGFLPALVFALPLFFCLNFNDTFDLPKLGLVYASVSFLLIGCVIDRWRNPSRPLFRTGSEWSALLFLGVAGVSAYFSIDSDISVMGFYRVHVFGMLPMAGFLILFWVAAQEDISDRMTLALMISGALVGIYAVCQFEGWELFQAMPRVVGGRPWSSLGNPVYMGAVCMMAVVVTFGEFGRKRYDQILLGVLAIGQSAGLVLSLSRSAWVGAFVGVVFLAILQQRKKSLNAVAIGLLFIVILIPSARQRAALLFSSSEVSNASRLAGWHGAIAVWRDHPLLGSGPDTFFEAFRAHRSMDYIRATGPEVTQAHAHNDFLQMAATLGTSGLIAFVVLLLTLGVRVVEGCLKDRQGPLVPLAAACAALCVQNQFNFSSVATTAWAAILLGHICRRPDTVIAYSAWPRVLRSASVMAAAGVSVLFLGVMSVSWNADHHFKHGQELIQVNQPVLALISFREAARLRPAVEAYQTEIGNTARTLATLSAPGSLRADLFKEAWSSAEVNTRRHPRDPDAWNNQGVVAMWRNQLGGEATTQDAREAFEHATQLDPFFVDAWANLAKWYHLQGDLEHEKTIWRNVLRIDPHHQMARAVLQQ
jgi:O-antigen ligase